MKYADIILPLPLDNRYTYRVPADMQAHIGQGYRVIVPFGKKRFYTGIVLNLHDNAPTDGFEMKEIFSLLDEEPIVTPLQLGFWQWIANYYLCKLGDVYKAALPSGLKLESETSVSINADFEASSQLRNSEQAVLDLLSVNAKLTVQELEKATGVKNLIPVLNRLIDMEAVYLHEEIKSGFKAKTETYLRIAPAFRSEEALSAIVEEIKRARKQQELLVAFLDQLQERGGYLTRDIPKKEFLQSTGFSTAVLDGVIKRGVIESFAVEASRIGWEIDTVAALYPLNEHQQRAYEEVKNTFETKEVCLLHGVTSSGKTEIYLHLIQEVFNAGKQVLFLVPEIALTAQLTERLKRVLGDKLYVYHSKYSDNERVEVWRKLLTSNEPLVILGVRSAVFLPFGNLGLVVVDEEHESTYKQQDPAPRYNGRNAAIVLAAMHKGKVILGSATPSLDSYFNAMCGKYGLVNLSVRHAEVKLPKIIPVDIKELRRKKQMKGLFSPLLLHKITETLERGEQVILFQNRRGFAPLLECKTCGWVPHCVNCDVSLTYHKYQNTLSCHYCGYTYYPPKACEACGSEELELMGFGTEKVEEEIAALFPDVRVDRLDLDTTRSKTAYERIIKDFESGKVRILIGTQMITKGLDFGAVSLVGILSAESLLNYPDFRAHERAFQMMVQVSGRAGRRQKQGEVVLQTTQITHPIIDMVVRFDYKQLIDVQLMERQLFKYPPYYRLINLIFRSKDAFVLDRISKQYAELLREKFGPRVLGPVAPPIGRVQTFYIKNIVIKIEVSAPIAPVRDVLDGVYKQMQAVPEFKQVLLHYDVDPM
ncbi:MAG: replication restart helicase PriA [Tannerellaceae bacterium]